MGELHGSNFYVGCVGYVGQKIFHVGHHFTWVIIFTWVAWVKYTFAWVQKFLLGSTFGRESKKNLDWHFHNNILVAH